MLSSATGEKLTCTSPCPLPPGIPAEQQKKIFQLFYRPGSELTRTTAGTGIGLALVKELASKMNARVDLKNATPGVEFLVGFPLKSLNAAC